MRGPLLLWTLLALLAPVAARAGAVATFAVDMQGSTVSGPASGRILGIGTATLDSSGMLTILLTTKAVTGWTESVQDSMMVVRGTLAANVLSPASGHTTVTSCTRTGGFFDACSHVVLHRAQALDAEFPIHPIVFGLGPGEVTRFEAEQVRALGARIHYVFHLTAFPGSASTPPRAPQSAESAVPSDRPLRRSRLGGLRPAGVVAGNTLADGPVVDGEGDGGHDGQVPSKGQ